MLTNIQKLDFIKDLINKGNPAFERDYDCILRINKQNADGSVDISLLNDGEPEGGATVDVVGAIIIYKYIPASETRPKMYLDGDEERREAKYLLEVDLGEGPRLISAVPHTLFAIIHS